MQAIFRTGLMLGWCWLLQSGAALGQQQADVPYVPTPWNVIEAMLEMGQVSAADYVVDLGSGDGRVVIEAAKKYGARGVGIELDGNLVTTATREARRLGVDTKTKFVSGNLFSFDFSSATVLTMYLLPKINLDLRPRVLSRLKPGTRVVSHDFDMGKWKPDAHREISVPNKSYGPPVSQIYLWYVPADVSGKWRWQLTVDGVERAFEATIRQTFQDLSAEVTLDGAASAIEGERLRGDAISFTVRRDIAGRKIAHEYTGRVDGDRIVGHARVAGEEGKMLDWRATRIARGIMSTE